ncbi:MAG: acyl-ACP thioesterase [Clostridium sp.]|jgi:acyl-ACP thioesterase|nr:acyl-ACP thioesterase [Clostridium sp.]
MPNKRFLKEYEIHYYETNSLQEATPITLLNYLEDSAISNSASVGYGVKDLMKAGAGWVLYRWFLKIYRYPKLGEKIKVQTWPSSFERFYGNRQFLISDAEEKAIVKAASIWIFFNIQKRKPMRIPDELINAYVIDETEVLKEPFPSMDFDFKPYAIKDFYVRRSDIDTNNHVNNKRYIDWILETLPQHIYENFRMESLDILYKKEAVIDSFIQSGCMHESEHAQALCLLHRMWDKTTGSELAVARTTWQKR